MKSITLLAAVYGIMLASCTKAPQPETISNYPVSAKVDTVDTYFGTQVPDPYRWMENDTTKQVADWVTAQNNVTFSYLKNISYRDTVRNRLLELNNYEKLSAPFRQGEYYYFYKNTGLQNQSVLYRKKGESGEPELFLDPNTFSKDGTTTMRGLSFSKDGSLLAFEIAKGGADRAEGVVIRTADKTLVEDTIRNMKQSGISWRGNDGYYINRFVEGLTSSLGAKNEFQQLYYHKLGTNSSQDKVVFGDIQKRRFVGGFVTEDEHYLVITTSESTTGNELYIQDLSVPNGKILPVKTGFESDQYVIENDGPRFFIQTNLNAPNGKVVWVDASNPSYQNWRDLIPETENSLNASAGGGKIFARYLVDVKTQIKQYDFTGKLDREVELPGIGTAGGFGGRMDDTDLYYTFTSFTYPPTIFKYDIASGKSTEYERPSVKFNPEDYETKQVFYASKDGTKIPMFIVHKKGIELNGKNPTWLYAYGGFNISLTPSFSTSRIVWLENGGIYAQPNLRGGGEYGEEWHLAGTKMKKQNVFDDFIAAGEYLIKEKYTSSEHLAINGGSNGGLLVGAVMAQRPDLAKVAVPQVGVMDMLRYHKFTIGAAWASDYGTSEDSKEMFDYLKTYSPVHALKPGVHYPATMVTTADHDDRVVPAHSFKFAATLQENQAGANQVLIRVDVNSAHGSSNITKSIDMVADYYSFAWYNMGVVPPIAKKNF
ncbi:MAG TPA: prolyl oligopeptidase family serine peptidase [Cyclobacteriaceae bacterium]|nr:prolyl oligopeptidase family serine peptidase [Cyclobacteriaceae bacterium]HRF34708.1 prolyl oligopeptidase family serine peptidase [Cyclobacteriaceae bacterium]